MSYRDSEGWRGPAHAPRHAVPLVYSVPARLRAWSRTSRPPSPQTREALRLAAAAGVWVAGLTMVIGLILLVISAAGPSGTARLRVTAHDSRAPVAHSTRTPRPAAKSAHGAGDVLVTYSGRGNATTSRFTVRAGTRWQLHWRFACPARLRAHQFTVADARQEADRTALGPSISDLAAHGRGVSPLSSAGGDHFLIVISDCSWTIAVVTAP